MYEALEGCRRVIGRIIHFCLRAVTSTVPVVGFAVRLSIHPQTCGAKKLGIRLIGNESWMTPWHGVALETKRGYVLIKRSQAIEMGAELIYDSSGHPSHYKLYGNNHISMEGI